MNTAVVLDVAAFVMLAWFVVAMVAGLRGKNASLFINRKHRYFWQSQGDPEADRIGQLIVDAKNRGELDALVERYPVLADIPAVRNLLKH